MDKEQVNRLIEVIEKLAEELKASRQSQPLLTAYIPYPNYTYPQPPVYYVNPPVYTYPLTITTTTG